MTNIEPYVIKLGQNIQKQWNSLLKYIEGPVYDKSIEIAEQVRIERKNFIPPKNSFIVRKIRRTREVKIGH
jgi:hypothetical protein